MAQFLPEHCERLKTACARCGFKAALPSAKEIALVLANAATGFARIYVTGGAGGVTDELDGGRVFVFVEDRKLVEPRVYHRGYDLGIAGETHNPLFAGLKTGNYWANVLAFRSGVARQHNETLLFNGAGELISACMANVFTVHRERIFTPPVSSGAREGVVRAWVLAQCGVEQRVLTVRDLESADEIFLTSSWLGIMPAASLEGVRLRSSEIAGKLLRRYRAAIEPSGPPASK